MYFMGSKNDKAESGCRGCRDATDEKKEILMEIYGTKICENRLKIIR